jgi:hypothetical protein
MPHQLGSVYQTIFWFIFDTVAICRVGRDLKYDSIFDITAVSNQETNSYR